MSDHTTFYTTLAKSVYTIWVLWARIRTHNPKVVGSNPAPATIYHKGKREFPLRICSID